MDVQGSSQLNKMRHFLFGYSQLWLRTRLRSIEDARQCQRCPGRMRVIRNLWCVPGEREPGDSGLKSFGHLSFPRLPFRMAEEG